MTVHDPFCVVQLWNEFGCVKCKAGLYPAYVPPVDNCDQQQDLPPKGRAFWLIEGKIHLKQDENQQLGCVLKGMRHMPSSGLTSVHLTSETHHHQYSFHQYPLSKRHIITHTVSLGNCMWKT